MNEIGLKIENITLHENHEMNINLTRNVESQYYIKYIDVQLLYIKASQ